MKDEQLARSLDIWAIFQKKFAAFCEDVSVDQAWINLGKAGGYVEISYYDLTSLVNNDDEPALKRFDLSDVEVNQMYREIKQVVDLPRNVFELKCHLRADSIPVFDLKLLPNVRV